MKSTALERKWVSSRKVSAAQKGYAIQRVRGWSGVMGKGAELLAARAIGVRRGRAVPCRKKRTHRLHVYDMERGKTALIE